MDRRLTPATPRVAHVSLKGRVETERFTEGEALRVALPLVDLLRGPEGPRERQLVLGEGFCLIDREGAHALGFALKDGYCGWLPQVALAAASEPTHWVASVGTHCYDAPRVQSASHPVPMAARLRVTGQHGSFAATDRGFVPATHLRAIGAWLSDPVAVSEGLLGTPYLWGGNSRAGVDCSGLVQMAFAACGVSLPGDSDLQQGAGVAVQGALRRGDLIFWKGHVAIVVDGARLIHANGFTLSVAYEGLDSCIARIAAVEGPVTARRRV